MVVDTESIHDHMADAPQGPALGLGSRLERPTREDTQDLFPLLGRQQRGATCASPAPEGIDPLKAWTHRFGPLTDGLGRHAESRCDLRASQPALAQEPTAFDAPFFHLARCEGAGGPHA
jgi:hypothetical protein